MGGICFVSGKFESFEQDREDKQKHQRQEDTQDHKSDAIPGLFDLIRFASREDKQKNRSEKAVNRSSEDNDDKG